MFVRLFPAPRLRVFASSPYGGWVILRRWALIALGLMIWAGGLFLFIGGDFLLGGVLVISGGLCLVVAAGRGSSSALEAVGNWLYFWRRRRCQLDG